MFKNILVDLGFINEKLPAGTHICQIYSDEKERDESLLAFLLKGIQSRERSACFTDNVTGTKLQEYFADAGIDYQEIIKSGAFSLNKTAEIYFQENRFDPEQMLAILTRFHEDSVAEGYSGARVIGEMNPHICHVAGGERLLEYECRVTMLLEQHPVTSICQYDTREFDGATIMDVLKVHPMMIVQGGVVHNPFYIPPEEFLNRIA